LAGLPTKENTSKAHGEPPGEDELNGAKVKLGWPTEPRFLVPQDVQAHFRLAVERGEKLEQEWQARLEAYRRAFPGEYAELQRRLRRQLPEGWETALPVFPADEKGVATRVASGKVINALAERLPELIGGSADLTPSTKTWIDRSVALQAGRYEGRNIHFGVREHAMGAIVNGMAVHGGLIPYGATFLTFADYMREPIRLSALSAYPSIWVFTHDSIGVGEDGPTHQPVEHLASLRIIPNLVVIRPADANEVSVAWKVAVQRRDGPTVLALTRQNVPILDRSRFAAAEGLERGAYVLADLGRGKPRLILMASGSEVHLIVQAGLQLAADGLAVRLVSFPSWELFAAQEAAYRQSVLPPSIKARLAVEAGVSFGWERWVGERGAILGINRYGVSAPEKQVYRYLGLTVEAIVTQAKQLLR
jgi:transketolase